MNGLLNLSFEKECSQALQKQGLNLQPGDAILIYTGWSKHWGVDNKLYMSGCPGIGVTAAEWLIKQDPMLLGSDNWPVEVAPNPDKQLSLPVHQIALVVNGVHLLENLKLDELAAKGVSEFALIVLGMLLFSERTWKHHCVVFMVPFAVLGAMIVSFTSIIGSLLFSQRPGSQARNRSRRSEPRPTRGFGRRSRSGPRSSPR